MLKKSVLAAAFATTLAVSHNAAATIVLVETNMGDFEINLFDQTTPKTVTNFLTYVKDGSYNNSIFHRSIKDFVVQGGGMRYSGNNASPFTEVPARGPIDNEPKLSNVRGTVAMAKKASPNSATTHWYVNVENNSSHLDKSNGGFTVFGVVTGTGMSIVDSINDLYVPGGAGLFNETPLRNYSATDWANKVPVTAANIVTIERITIINDSPTTAANLNPAPNTLAGQGETEGASSGSSAPTLLMVLAGLAFWRRRKV
jgi:MYXO-CTERM domain-containing protein